jgi:hypothetical protein
MPKISLSTFRVVIPRQRSLDGTLGGTTVYEYFPEDGNYLYAIAQWFPTPVRV